MFFMSLVLLALWNAASVAAIRAAMSSSLMNRLTGTCSAKKNTSVFNALCERVGGPTSQPGHQG